MPEEWNLDKSSKDGSCWLPDLIGNICELASPVKSPKGTPPVQNLSIPFSRISPLYAEGLQFMYISIF